MPKRSLFCLILVLAGCRRGNAIRADPMHSDATPPLGVQPTVPFCFYAEQLAYAWAPNGSTMAMACGGDLQLVHLPTFTLVSHVATRSPLMPAAFTADGNRVIARAADGEAFVWDPITGAVASFPAIPRDADQFAISIDGQRMVVIQRHVARLCDGSGATIANLIREPPHVDVYIGGAAFDRRAVVAVAVDYTLRTFDASTGAPLREYPGAYRSMRFSPTGKTLYASRGDGGPDNAVDAIDVKSGDVVGTWSATYFDLAHDGESIYLNDGKTLRKQALLARELYADHAEGSLINDVHVSADQRFVGVLRRGMGSMSLTVIDVVMAAPLESPEPE